MEDFAQYLLDEARSGGASLHEFILQYNEADAAFHLFFEGEEDPAFYMPYVRRRAASQGTYTYVCGGKPVIKSIREYLRIKGYSFDRLMFFVDRDLDDFLGTQIDVDDAVYVTDYYSIENHLVGKSQAEIVLVDLAGCRHGDSNCTSYLGLVERLLKRCANVMAPFMAVALAARAAGIRTNFNNLNLAKIVTMSGEPLAVRKTRQSYRVYAAAILPAGTKLEFRDILKWRRTIQQYDDRVWFRGKYQLWFFEKLLSSYLVSYIAKRKAAKQKAPKLPASLREGRLFEALGGRVPEVPSLAAFLDRRLWT